MDILGEQGITKLQDSGDKSPSCGLSPSQTQRCLEFCAAVTVDFIQERFAPFWADWLESVKKREENARSNKEQMALLEVVKLLSGAESAVMQRLLEFSHQNFDDFASRQLQTPTGQERFGSHSGLSLVENSELEETIAITSICHRADSAKCRGTLGVGTSV